MDEKNKKTVQKFLNEQNEMEIFLRDKVPVMNPYSSKTRRQKEVSTN